MQRTSATNVASNHFVLEQLADGAHAVIGRSPYLGNAGIVDLGGSTVVLDALRLPQAALELRHVAEQLHGRPVDILINTHWHGDHNYGNQSFSPDTKLIATPLTAELIATRGRTHLAGAQAEIPDRVDQLARDLEREPAGPRRDEMIRDLAMGHEILATLGELEIRAPEGSIETRTVLSGQRRTIELIEYRGGHTASDVVVFLPGEGIVFVADLLVVETHPAMADGDPDIWGRHLAEILGMGANRFVPGHGRVGTQAEIRTLCAYLHEIAELARSAHRDGVTREELGRAAIPPAYHAWAGSQTYHANLRVLHERLA